MRKDVCKFYDGGILRGDKTECEAGINPVQSFCGGELTGWVKKVPCFLSNKDAPDCAEKKFPTVAEVKESEAKSRKNMESVMEVIAQIPAKGTKGTVKCPNCENVVDWVRSTYNGHRHARCRTEGCLFFME